MIDMHSHILPGIDDGAKTPGDALALLRAAIKDGVRTQVLTPHIHQGKYDNSLSLIRKEFDKFSNAIRRAGLPIELDFAAEVRLDDSVKELVKQEEIPFLGGWKGRDVMLLEFPANNIPVGALNIVRWLYDRGIIAMIAHPERNRELQQKPEKIRPFLEQGCMLQVTAGSFTVRTIPAKATRTTFHYIGPGCKKFNCFLFKNPFPPILSTIQHHLRKNSQITGCRK